MARRPAVTITEPLPSDARIGYHRHTSNPAPTTSRMPRTQPARFRTSLGAPRSLSLEPPPGRPPVPAHAGHRDAPLTREMFTASSPASNNPDPSPPSPIRTQIRPASRGRYAHAPPAGIRPRPSPPSTQSAKNETSAPGSWSSIRPGETDVDADAMEAWQLTYGAETYTPKPPQRSSTVTTTSRIGTGSVSQPDGGDRLDPRSTSRQPPPTHPQLCRVRAGRRFMTPSTHHHLALRRLGPITRDALPIQATREARTRTTAIPLTNGNDNRSSLTRQSHHHGRFSIPQGRTVLRYGFGT